MNAFLGLEANKEAALRRVGGQKGFYKGVVTSGERNSVFLEWVLGMGCGFPINFERELGIPAVIAAVLNSVFRRLPMQSALELPENFLTNVNPGADLTGVWPAFVAWLLDDPEDGVIRFALRKEMRVALRHFAKLYRDRAEARDFCEGALGDNDGTIAWHICEAAFQSRLNAETDRPAMLKSVDSIVTASASAEAYAATAQYFFGTADIATYKRTVFETVFERQRDKLLSLISACGC